jgi:hypothetical protein
MASRALEAEEAREVSPLARVRRGHWALALSVTLAGLPVLVLDNLPATAETNEGQVAAVVARPTADDSSTTRWEIIPPTTESPATTAPPTTEAPPSTEAPTTTELERQAVVARPAPPPAPTTTAAPPPPPAYGDPSDPATWDRLARCESGGNWAMDSGNGYYGGLQFSLGTWHDVGGTGYPHQASRAEQIKRGQILQARQGWGAWPGCTRELGYR